MFFCKWENDPSVLCRNSIPSGSLEHWEAGVSLPGLSPDQNRKQSVRNKSV